MVREPVLEEVPGFYRVVALNVFRRTPGVSFDTVPMEILPRIDAIDRVIHDHGAQSPGPVGKVDAPWYMHPHQDDNLIVLYGRRQVELYTQAGRGIETFRVGPNRVEWNGTTLFEGPVMVTWPRNVFHRITSDPETGSASLNFAVRHEGFDIRTNFNIYDVETSTGAFSVIREGHLDQQRSST